MNRYNSTDSFILSLLYTVFVLINQFDFAFLVSKRFTMVSNICADMSNISIRMSFDYLTNNESSFNIRSNQNDEDGQLFSHR